MLVSCSAGVVIPVTVFVGTLVAVIALLLLSVTAIMVGLCVYLRNIHRWQRQGNQADSENEYDYVTSGVKLVTETSCSMEMEINEAYGTHSTLNDNQDSNTVLERTESTDQETFYEELNHK